MQDIDKFEREELLIDPLRAQFQSIFYVLPWLPFIGLPYYLIWRFSALKEIKLVMFKLVSLGTTVSFVTIFSSFIFIVLGGIILHEFIHGITWARFAKNGHKSIKYGIIWKAVTPYCHCKEPLLVKHYILGAFMPGLILGILPSIYALLTGNSICFLIGGFFTLAAGGDFMIIFKLLKQNFNNYVLDHPSKIGCFIYKSEL